MREASFYQRDTDGSVHCQLCCHHCKIAAGKRGICGVRENQNGILYSLVYGKVIAEHLDPIEKKPLFHFLPGSRSYSIATVGCNFRCLHCQNYNISQYPHREKGVIAGTDRSPEQIVSAALDQGASSISYTYVEPTIFYEFAYDCMVLAREHGLKNVLVSNGYQCPEVIEALAPLLDAINIDIKAFTEHFYQTVCRARLQPVLDAVALFHARGVWVEVTTLLIPGLNDDVEELRRLAGFIHAIDPAIPWHVTAFYPTYQMTDRPPTTAASLLMAVKIGKEAGLQFVYAGNIPGAGGEDTRCPGCGSVLIERVGFSIRGRRLEQGKCPDCGFRLSGIW